MNKVLSQGEYDGGCFLYSAANAYRILTGKKPTQKRWNEALKWIPFSSDFITDNGTVRYDEDMALYEFALRRIFRDLSGSSDLSVSSELFEITGYASIESPSELGKLIKKDSVAIVNVESEHWLVCVESSKNSVFAACSDQLRIKRAKYEEHVSERFGRHYNLELEVGASNWVHNPSVFQIKRL